MVLKWPYHNFGQLGRDSWQSRKCPVTIHIRYIAAVSALSNMSSADNTSTDNTSTDNTSTDNFTSTYSTPVSDPVPDLFKTDIASCLLMALTLTVFIVGVASWIKFKNIRTLKNYVFLNIMFSRVLMFVAFSFNFYGLLKYFEERIDGVTSLTLVLIYDFFLSYFVLVFTFRVLVLSCIFYVDIVKVFNANITRRYSKSSLFAWGIPIIIVLVVCVLTPLFFYILEDYFSKETLDMVLYISTYMETVVLLFPLVIGIVIYIKVLITLFKTAKVNKTSVRSSQVYVATMIFLFSGAVLFIEPLIDLFETSMIFGEILGSSHIVAIDVYFLIVKSNRIVWQDYYTTLLKTKTLN